MYLVLLCFLPCFAKIKKNNGWYGSSWNFFTLIIVLSSLKSLSPLAEVANIDDEDSSSSSVLLSTNLQVTNTIFEENYKLPGAILFSGPGILTLKNNCFINNYFEPIEFDPFPSYYPFSQYVYPVNVAETKAVSYFQTVENFVDIPNEENFPKYIESIGNYVTMDEYYYRSTSSAVSGNDSSRVLCGMHNWTINDIVFGRESNCIHHFDIIVPDDDSTTMAAAVCKNN